MLDNLNNTFLGPLDRKYCIYFYYLTVAGLILFLFLIASSIYIGFTNKYSSVFIYKMVMVTIVYGMFYFQNRLLYSMCVNTL